jgi:glycosyltransferase involved in cell wall biosynthesis
VEGSGQVLSIEPTSGVPVTAPAAPPSLRPSVTVVIPTVDRWHMLESHSLPSALGQTDVDVEVVVVADGSPDSLVRNVEALGDARVRVVRHQPARGVAAARNSGLAAAETPWVAFLDDDDLWSAAKLARQIEAAKEAGAGFAYCGALVVDERLAVRHVIAAPDPGDLLPLLLRHNVVPGGCANVVALTELARRVGGFDESLRYSSDWDFYIRLAGAASAAVVPDPLIAYVRHPEVDRPDPELVERDFARLVAKHGELAFRHGQQLDKAFLVNWAASGQLETHARLPAFRLYLRNAWSNRKAGDVLRGFAALLPRRVNTGLRRALKRRQHVVPEWLEAAREAARR